MDRKRATSLNRPPDLPRSYVWRSVGRVEPHRTMDMLVCYGGETKASAQQKYEAVRDGAPTSVVVTEQIASLLRQHGCRLDAVSDADNPPKKD